MKTLIMSVLIISSILATPLAIAVMTPEEQKLFPQTPWTSTDSKEYVKIENGAGVPILIVITVSANEPNSTGINLKNCGTTSHVDRGSTAVCATQDRNNPVTISSDSASKSASGTYQIKQQ